MDQLKSKISLIKQFENLRKTLKERSVHLENLNGSLRSFVLENISESLSVPVLYIANSLESAEKLHDDLEFIRAKTKPAFLPGLFIEPYETSKA